MITEKIPDKARKILALLLAIIVAAAYFPVSSDLVFGETAASYNADRAISYAKAHYDDGYTATTPDKGDCTQFVRECFEAGGIPKDNNRVNDKGAYGYDVGDYRAYLVDNGYAEVYGLTREKQEWSKPQWYVRANTNESKLSVGDGVLYYCKSCKRYFHMSIATGVNSDGFVLYHAQNRAVGGEPLCSIDCFKCGADRENVMLYSMHLTTGNNGYVTDYNGITVTGLNVYRTGNDTLNVSWDPVSGAAGYKVFIKNGAKSVFNLVKDTKETSFIHKEDKAGESYYFAVRPYFERDGKKYVGKLSNTAYNNDKLVAPTGVKAAISGSTVVITWNKVPGADKYQVYRSSSKNSGYSKVFECTGTSFKTSKSNFKAGYTYYFKVKAINADNASGNSALSAAVSVKIPGTAKVSTTALYSASSGKPIIKWEKVTGASKYQVYRATSSKGEYSRLITTSKLSYTNTSAKAGYTYYYKVNAVNSSGKVIAKGSAVKRLCMPAKPSVKTSLSTAGKPKLTWNKITGVSKYQVYRATSSKGKYTRLITTTRNYYTNTSAKAGTTYYYKVKAIASKNANAYSQTGAIKKMCTVAKPVLKKGYTTKGKPYISWKSVSGAKKYEVYRATSKSGKYTKLITTTKRSYSNTSAKKGKTYYYKVKAVGTKTSNYAYSTAVAIKSK